jgi:hypothetical protein
MSFFNCVVKINPYSNSLFITVKLDVIRKMNLVHKQPIKITIFKNNIENSFIATLSISRRYNKMRVAKIFINKYIVKMLNLIPKDKIYVTLQKANFEKSRPQKCFRKDKIDLMHFVPKNMFVVNNYSKIILWKPKRRSIEVNRFVDINAFGRFFGLLFSEGQKCTNTTGPYVSITNKQIEPHLIVIDFLRKLGLARIIKTYCYYNPSISKVKLDRAVVEYQKKTGFMPKAVKSNRKGDFAYLTNINSTLLGELLLNTLNIISICFQDRRLTTNLRKLADNFIATELTGDGHMDNGRFKSVTVGETNPDRRLTLVKLLNKLKFNPKITQEGIVYFDVSSVDKLLYLVDIDAFCGNNRKNLLHSLESYKFIHLQMGRINKIKHINEFSNKDISRIFNWFTLKTTKWLLTMKEQGYIFKTRKVGYDTFYNVANNINIERYNKWKGEYNLLSHENQIGQGAEQT